MAGLADIPQETIESLERGLASLGLDVGAIDGEADDALRAGTLQALQTLNRMFANGQADGGVYSPEAMAAIRAGVEGFMTSEGDSLSQFAMLKALVDQDYDALGLGLMQRGAVSSFFANGSVAESMPALLEFIAQQPDYAHIATLLERIPAHIMDDVPAALEFLAEHESYLGAIDALGAAEFLLVDGDGAAAPVIPDAEVSEGDVEVAVDAEVETPVSAAQIQASVMTVQLGLQQLIPYVQSELDAKRDEAQDMMDQIDGKGSGAAEFIDGFILSTVEGSDLGQRLADMGRNWAKDMITSRLANVHDIPAAGDLTDGVLDLHDQAALQGVLFLLATKFEINGVERTPYSPELGRLLFAEFENSSFADQESIVLGMMSEDARVGYDALDDEGKRALVEAEFAGIKEQIDLVISALDTLDSAGVLVQQRLYNLETASVSQVTHDIFQEYTDAHQGAPAQVALLNGLVNQFTGGLSLRDMTGSTLPEGVRDFDASMSDAENMAAFYQEAFDALGATSAADFEDKLDIDVMLDMLETTPFGGEARRDAFRDIVQQALAAARRAEAENAGTDVSITALLASAFGDSMQAGIGALDANPETQPDYLFMRDRPIVVDPRLENFSIVSDDRIVTEDDIFAAYRAQNNDFKSLNPDYPEAALWGVDHEPMFIRADDGQVYVAVIDLESRVLQIEPLHVEALEAAIEAQVENGGRVDPDALSEISPGFDLIFQRGDWGTWNHFKSYEDFPNQIRSQIQPFSEFSASTMRPDAQLETQDPLPVEGTLEAEAPLARDSGMRLTFSDAVGGMGADLLLVPSEDLSFGAIAAEITSPSSPQSGDDFPIGAPVVAPPTTSVTSTAQ